jgi:hypothetical protein
MFNDKAGYDSFIRCSASDTALGRIWGWGLVRFPNRTSAPDYATLPDGDITAHCPLSH